MAELVNDEAVGEPAATLQTEPSTICDSALVQTESSADGDCLQGFLFKKSTKGEWNKRYFEVNGSYLVYYKNNKMQKMLAALALVSVGAIKLVGDETLPGDKNSLRGQNKGYLFTIDLKDRQLALKAQTLLEAEKWVTSLTETRNRLQVEQLNTERITSTVSVASTEDGRGTQSVFAESTSNYSSSVNNALLTAAGSSSASLKKAPVTAIIEKKKRFCCC
jgi:hypothetical protein